MNDSEKVYVDDRAWIGWQKLPGHVKTVVLRTLEPLAGLPPDRWPARIKPWRSEENLYVLPVWVDADELFVFIYPNGGRIHVESMLYRALIEQLRGRPVTELA